MSTRKILFITEGEKTEVEALKRLLGAVSRKEYEFYEYRKDLSSLIKLIFSDNEVDDAMDIQLLLAEHETDADRKRKLQDRYSDIFLVFDLDPQRDYSDKEIDRISMLIQHFSNSSDEGHIYINYPLMESYIHIKSPDDETFSTRKVSLKECREYKRIVNEFTYLKDPSKIKNEDFIGIVKLHLRKAKYILGNGFILPEKDEYFSWNGNDIFAIQKELLINKGMIWVLNTSLFSIVSYNSEHFLANQKRNT